MMRINVLAIGMIVLGVGPVHLFNWMMGYHALSMTSIAAGLVLLALDLVWRSRANAATPKERWLSGEKGGIISIFPIWGIGLFSLVYGGLLQAGYQV